MRPGQHRQRGGGSLMVLGLCLAALAPRLAHAQIEFTEVMFQPGGDDSLWEWVEILNTSAAPVNLDGWVFDDDDDPSRSEMSGPNIRAANGNTIVPAGSPAVLYPADEFGFDPARFQAAWGSGITLIPVDGFTALTAGDAIGLWPSMTAYLADDLDTTTQPRRTFASAVASLNYHMDNGFPNFPSSRPHSIAWSGSGGVHDGSNWVESEEDVLGALASTETFFDSIPINSQDDVANPGTLPGGAAPPGLRITEIMYDPRSPAIPEGFAENDFEWIEVFNNTPSAIDFTLTPYVLDDIAGNDLTAANITSGMLAPGAAGVLFNAQDITIADMQTMWGGGITFIPTLNWPELNNDGDTIALWDSLEDYEAEPMRDSGRSQMNAVAVVTYDDVDSEGWPNNDGNGSIYLADLGLDPLAGESWVLSGSEDDVLASVSPMPLEQTAVDHPGGDVGSPGFVPGTIIVDPVFGDYNNDGRVDGADYTVWRDLLGSSSPMPNDLTPGSVTLSDYDVWKSAFGTIATGAGGAQRAVPEPVSAWMFIGGIATLLYCRAILARCRCVPLLATDQKRLF